MPEAYIALTPVHWFYLVGVLVILFTMILRKDTPLVCIAFLFGIGVVGKCSLAGGIQTIFSSIIYAISEFREVIATIALVTAFSKCLRELGSDALLMKPVSKVMRTPAVSWWILGGIMFVFSLFLWPSPAVALVGAIVLPIAVQSGLTPLAAAMAMNLFGHGFALSYDAVIQGAPAISAGAADISTTDILSKGRPLFWIMGITCVCSAFLLNRMTLAGQRKNEDQRNNLKITDLPEKQEDSGEETPEEKGDRKKQYSTTAKTLAVLTPIAFLMDILFMFLFKLGSIFKTSSLLRIFNPLTPFSLPFIYKLFIFFISSSSKANTKDPFLLKGTDSSLHNSSNISLPFTLYLAINVPTFGSYPA